MFRNFVNISISILLLLPLVLISSCKNIKEHDHTSGSKRSWNTLSQNEIVTKESYKINEEIEIGNPANII